MLLLLLAMPVALLLMVCMLGRYERLIVEPIHPHADEPGVGLEPRPVTRAATVAGELGSDLAPEAA